jgi:hypothetical protein
MDGGKMTNLQVRQGFRDVQVPGKLLDSVRELNHRFLDLVGVGANGWATSRRVGLSAELSDQLAPLTAAQKNAVANCPYVLFDLRFDDELYWSVRLAPGREWQVADAPPVDENTLHFTSLALFFAWHVASTAALSASWLFGMSEATASCFRNVTVDRLPALAGSAAESLTARWCERPRYWAALTAAAVASNPRALRRVQLSGLRLAAAAGLA